MKRLLTLLPLLLSACAEKPRDTVKPPAPVRAATVEPFSPKSNERYSASLVPFAQVIVSPKTGGYVEEILQVRGVDGRAHNAGLGDVVAKGALLARLRSRDFNIKVTEATLQADEARKARTTLDAQFRQAQAMQEKARLDFERAQKLFDSRSLIKPDYDAARAQRDASNAQLDAIRSQMESADARIRTAESLIEEARYAKEDSELHAPIGGAILQRNIESGQLTAPGQAAFVLADISTVKAVLGVPDRDIVHLKKGRRLSLLVEAIPGVVFSGLVTALAPTADPTTRLFQVEVTIPNPRLLLLPGMIATLSISDDGPAPAQPVLTVPLSAVIRGKDSGEQFAVVLIEDHRARRRNVTLGETYGSRIAVIGLKSGDTVVATGAALLQEGEQVQVVP